MTSLIINSNVCDSSTLEYDGETLVSKIKDDLIESIYVEGYDDVEGHDDVKESTTVYLQDEFNSLIEITEELDTMCIQDIEFNRFYVWVKLPEPPREPEGLCLLQCSSRIISRKEQESRKRHPRLSENPKKSKVHRGGLRGSRIES